MTDNGRMNSAGTSVEPFHLDGWLVLPALNRIRRGEETVHVEPRVMTVLVCLAGRPGEVLSREVLFDTVWPGAVVCEEALTRTISELRRVFRDDAKSPRVIETIRKSGYRLVAPISPAGAPHPPVSLLRGSAWWVAAATAAVAVLAIVELHRGPGDRAAHEWTVRPLTAYPGMEYTPAISPDGSMLVFSWLGETPGESLLDLYVMQVESGTPVRLTEDAGHELYPTWSPDGSTIAYACGVSDSFEVCTVPLLGGERRRLTSVRSQVMGLDWSADGQRLAYSAQGDSGTSFRIHLLDLDDMRSSLLDVPHSHGDDVTPAFSPDGSALAFVREESYAHQRVLHTRIGSGDVEELSGVQHRIAGLDWASDRELVVSSSNLVDYDLWLVDLDSGRRTWFTVPGRPAVSPSIGRGGSRLVYGELGYECNIWSVALGDDGGVRASDEPIIASTRLDYKAVCSPNGESIAFLSDRSGHIELWIADADGGNPRQLTREIGAYLMNPCWSPDGTRLAYSAMSDDRLSVFLTEVATRVNSTVSAGDRHELLVHWSTSGEWLYSRVQREDGWELWRRRPDGGDAQRMTETGFTVLGEIERGDLLCRKDGDPGIWRLPAAGGVAQPVVSGEVAKDWTGAAVAEDGLFFIRTDLLGASLGFYDWASSHEDSLGPVPIDSGMLSISPDGTTLLYDSTSRFEIDLMLAEIAQ